MNEKSRSARKPTYLKTPTAIAECSQVTYSTVRSWIRKQDFPTATEKGWSRAEVEKFLKRKSLGPYRREKSVQSETDELKEWRLKLLREKTRREKISRQIEEVELRKAMGEIVLVSQVGGAFRQLAATIRATLEGLPDQVEREVPKEHSELAKRMVEVATPIVKNALQTIREFKWDPSK